MSDHDEMDLLARANPVPVPDPFETKSPAAQALFEEIVMSTDTDTPTERRTATVTELGSRRPRWLLPAGGVAAVAASVAGVLALSSGGGSPAGQAADPIDPGAITPGGTSLACLEVYELATLTNRSLAFAGTVEAVDVDADTVTFSVGEWFAGDDGSSEITLAGASVIGGFTAADAPVPVEVGTELLVAGEPGFAWGCGFTQPYDEAVAADWRAAFGS